MSRANSIDTFIARRRETHQVRRQDFLPTENPVGFFASPADDAPPRISGVSGLTESFALIKGGRVEAFTPCAKGVYGGLQLHRNTLSLGTWAEPDYLGMLMAFHQPNRRIAAEDFQSHQKILDLVPVTDGVTNWPSKFQWLLKKANVQATTCGLWFNQNRDAPVCYLTDLCTDKRILDADNLPPGYHCFDLSISDERLRRVWLAIGTGD